MEFTAPTDRRVTITYSNSAQVSISNEDVSIGFGVRDQHDPRKTLVTTRVYMSHAHAKRLVGALSRGLEALESEIGEIETNPGDERLKEAYNRRVGDGEEPGSDA